MKHRILHVIDSLGTGGAERVVSVLAREQSRRHLVSVAPLFPADDLAAELRASGVEVHPIGLRGWRDLGLASLRLARLVNRLDVDVIHAHLTAATVAAALVPSPFRRIVTFHNLGLAGGAKGGARTRLLREMLRQLVPRRFTHVTAVSEASAIGYQRELRLPVRPLVMRNPVDLDQLRALAPASQQVARSALGLPLDGPVVISVAKLTWEKNHQTLLEAIARLPREARPLLAVVGDGPLFGELRATATRLGVMEWIRWCGARPSAEIPVWLRAATVFVLPSVSEGQPVSVLEAMGIGVPVIATRVGGVPELVGDGVGWLVNPRDAVALAAALADCLLDSARRAECSARSIGIIERDYLPSVVARDWEAVLGL